MAAIFPLALSRENQLTNEEQMLWLCLGKS
jgi:hypothetical protein